MQTRRMFYPNYVAHNTKVSPMTDKIIKSMEEAIALIEAFAGRADDFKLRVSDKLEDPAGIFMAIITDAILGKGWESDGIKQEEGFRAFSFKELE
jgi:hypothetical protein